MCAYAVEPPVEVVGNEVKYYGSKCELGDYELPILIRETVLRIFAHQVERPDLIKMLTEDETLHSNEEFINLVQTELNAVLWLRQTNTDPEINSTLKKFTEEAGNIALNGEQQEITEYIKSVIFTDEFWLKFDWKLILMFFDFVCQYSLASINTPVDAAGEPNAVDVEGLQTSGENIIEAVFFGIGGNKFLCDTWETCWISVTDFQKRKDIAAKDDERVQCIISRELRRNSRSHTTTSSSSVPFKLSFAHITREVACSLISCADGTPYLREALTRIPHFDNIAHYQLIHCVVADKLDEKIENGELVFTAPDLEEDLKLCEKLFHLCPLRYHNAVMRVIDDALISVMMKQRGKDCWDTMFSLFHHVCLAVKHIAANTSYTPQVKEKLYQALLEAIYNPLTDANPPPELQTYRYLLNNEYVL